VTTGGDGLAYFAGINDDGTYYLFETEAPSGYNRLESPIAVTFDDTADEDNAFSMSVLAEYSQGLTLPKTGGIGSVLFTVLGVAIIGGGVLLVTAGKKKTKSK
jgi:LPXTG-motif cell wall-anchored protein